MHAGAVVIRLINLHVNAHPQLLRAMHEMNMCVHLDGHPHAHVPAHPLMRARAHTMTQSSKHGGEQTDCRNVVCGAAGGIAVDKP